MKVEKLINDPILLVFYLSIVMFYVGWKYSLLLEDSDFFFSMV